MTSYLRPYMDTIRPVPTNSSDPQICTHYVSITVWFHLCKLIERIFHVHIQFCFTRTTINHLYKSTTYEVTQVGVFSIRAVLDSRIK